jgi:hypothetical protein
MTKRRYSRRFCFRLDAVVSADADEVLARDETEQRRDDF